MLDLEDMDIRIAAGETLALLFDVLREISETEDQDFDLYDYDGFVDIAELLEKLKDLSASSSQHISKKDRAKQKSVFKDILKSVQVTQNPSLNGTII